MDSNESVYTIARQFSRRLLISESVATRLYNSINVTNTPIQSADQSLMSICSSNEAGHSCRICRWNRNDLPVQECPCECKGSVGYIHLKCLRRWILHRGDDHCEICGTKFILAADKWSYIKLCSSFFQSKYFGAILKNCVHLISLAPISYIILYQILEVTDNLQFVRNSDNTLQLRAVALAPILLFTSSFIFFNIFEFAITRCLVIKNILKHWWNFGGQDPDSELDMEVPSEIFEFF